MAVNVRELRDALKAVGIDADLSRDNYGQICIYTGMKYGDDEKTTLVEMTDEDFED